MNRDFLKDELLKIQRDFESDGDPISAGWIKQAITQLKADKEEIERLQVDGLERFDKLVKNEESKERAWGKAEQLTQQIDTLKAENERLRSLAYDDGDTHFSWKELAQQLQQQNASLRAELGEARAEDKRMMEVGHELHGMLFDCRKQNAELRKAAENLSVIIHHAEEQGFEISARDDRKWLAATDLIQTLTPQPKKEECPNPKCGGKDE